VQKMVGDLYLTLLSGVSYSFLCILLHHY